MYLGGLGFGRLEGSLDWGRSHGCQHLPDGELGAGLSPDGVCVLLQGSDGCGGPVASLTAGFLVAIFPGFLAGHFATGVFPS